MEATPFALPVAESSDVSSSVSRCERGFLAVGVTDPFALVVSPGTGREGDPGAGERLTLIRASAQTSLGRDLLRMNQRNG